MTTTRTLITGFILATLACIPAYQWIFHQKFSVFPLGWAGSGLHYIAIFFHEIGHTVAAWFYGYITLPMFDFTHGGGFAYMLSGSNPLVLACIWGALLYGIYTFRAYKIIAIGLAGLLLLNLATFHNEGWRLSIINFMGPAFEALVAGFLLFRALFDLAPRGNLERILNALFGFGMIFRIFIDSYGLLHNQTHRLSYYKQKGSHGFGDFDKIANQFYGLDFEMVIYCWSGLALLCLLIPLILKATYKN